MRVLPLLLMAPVLAFAHAGKALEPHDVWTAWRFDPGVLAPLAASAILYLRGHGATRAQIASFWAGWISLALALVSPLHPVGEVLFSAHMAQHEVLMLVAAPLLVLSRPLVPMLWGLPLRWRRAVGPICRWRGLTPLSAWGVHAIALWAWHVPRLFQATLTSEWVHTAQHLSFFLSAVLFWWSLFHSNGHFGYGTAVLYVFTTSVHTSILGALLTFAPSVWYPAYAATTAAWGLTPVQDQQIGGLIMWIPAGVVYLGIGLYLFAHWLRESESVPARSEYAD
jgi:putative membrane protein